MAYAKGRNGFNGEKAAFIFANVGVVVCADCGGLALPGMACHTATRHLDLSAVHPDHAAPGCCASLDGRFHFARAPVLSVAAELAADGQDLGVGGQ